MFTYVHTKNNNNNNVDVELGKDFVVVVIFVFDPKLQELTRLGEEQRLQHEVAMREQVRAHVTQLEVKDEEHKHEKHSMEKDIRKLCKLIDKLKKRLQEKGSTLI